MVCRRGDDITKDTPLHRGFSLFLFNSKNELLLTQRALNKQTFPGVWTNTVCGHSGPGETVEEAAKRRLYKELRIKYKGKIREAAPYRYKFADKNGIVENEICPILVAYGDVAAEPNPEEVIDWKWIKWEEFLQEIKINPQKYSPWCVEETQILEELI
ncbi:isopentenyl-diphosphate Delta-isomerase [Candidatus Gottesmanbacteria bacterium]|nr:isopentenyl-diphosphate Delta-isomerase [Candidatus Gottesmanbacteria bacterium]